MRSPRREIIDLLEQLPDSMGLETLLSEIHFKLEMLQRVERIDRGEVEFISHDDVKQRYNGWLTSPGQ